MARARLALSLGFGLAIAFALALPGDARPRAPRPTLKPCASTEGLLCGFVSVPLDYSHPKGRRLRLFVTAQPKKDDARGTILLLAGAPGEASTTVFDLTSDLWSSLFPGYNIAAYDDRGTGDSAALSCRGAKTAARCAAAIGPRRAFYGTRENVATWKPCGARSASTESRSSASPTGRSRRSRTHARTRRTSTGASRLGCARRWT
jgi:hypothetical protein